MGADASQPRYLFKRLYNFAVKKLSSQIIRLWLRFLLVVFIIAYLPGVGDLLQLAEARLTDQFFHWRSTLKGLPRYQPITAEDVVLISIDNESIRKLGLCPPWPRQLYALLTEKLVKSGAKVIGFAMVLHGPSPLFLARAQELPPKLKNFIEKSCDYDLKEDPHFDDQSLIGVFRGLPNVVLASDIEASSYRNKNQGSYLLPFQPFVTALGGSSNCLGNMVMQPDHDGLVRTSSLVVNKHEPHGSFGTSFALRVVEKQLGFHSVVDDKGRVVIGEYCYPASFRINYLDSKGSFYTLPFWKALEWEKHCGIKQAAHGWQTFTKRQSKDNPFEDKIVLIGYQDYSPYDALGQIYKQSVALPVATVLVPQNWFAHEILPMELQANIIANVLSRRFLQEPEVWEYALILLFAVMLFGRIQASLIGQRWLMLGVAFAVAAIWVVVSFLAFVYLDSLIPFVIPVLGIGVPTTLLLFIRQFFPATSKKLNNTNLLKNLGQPARIEEIQDNPELKLTGKEMVVTCLVCEMSNFQIRAYKYPPQMFLMMFNQCLDLMISAIYENDGVVSKPLSYGVLALWGAPINMPAVSQAKLASSCALEIQNKILEITKSWQEKNWLALTDGLALSCSINTGPAVCGEIGAHDYHTYGAFGATVDDAFALKEINTRYGTQCVVGEETAKLLGQSFELRELHKLNSQDINKSLYVFELLSYKGRLSGAMEESISLYKQGMAALAEKNYEQAEQFFASALRMCPNDTPTARMVDRCRYLGNYGKD